MANQEYFVVRVDAKGEIVDTVAVPEDRDPEEFATSGIGCFNYITKTEKIIDKCTPAPKDVAEETARFLQEVIKGRRHSTSPQCLPVSQWRRLEELATMYERAVELSNKEKGDE
jgi:hypothetical protein